MIESLEYALPVSETTLNPERSFIVNSRMTAFISLPLYNRESKAMRTSRTAIWEASKPSIGCAVPVS